VSDSRSGRSTSFGQEGGLTYVDRLGVWLSQRKALAQIAPWRGKDVGDFGCGYQAALTRRILPDVASATIADVAIAPDLREHQKVHAIEGPLPQVLSKVKDASLDIVLCVAVLEHLWEPDVALSEFHRILRVDGVAFFTVPTWLDKWPLEFSAFRLGLSPPEEMNDHKRYYSPRDFWPMLVRAGFLPQDIRCRRHKFGLHTFATCRKRNDTVGLR
jgi:SAM-dependent methyltransferase